MAETGSLSAPGRKSVSLYGRKVRLRWNCASDDFRRLSSRGLAVSGVAGKLRVRQRRRVGIGCSGLSARWWERPGNHLTLTPPGRPRRYSPHPIRRCRATLLLSALQLVGRLFSSAAGDTGPGAGPGSRSRPAVCAPACWLGRACVRRLLFLRCCW